MNQLPNRKKEPYVTTRKALSKTYTIDIKTFNKWVQIFADPALLDYNTFSKQRGITQQQNNYLTSLFGSPTEDKPKYSKMDIVALDEDDFNHREYISGRESIKAFYKKYNITPEIYAQLNLFPPKIGRELKQSLGA